MFHACPLITMSTICFLWKLRRPYCWGDGRNGASALIWAPRMWTKGYVALQSDRAQDIFLMSWFGISGPKRKSPGIRDDCWILWADNDGEWWRLRGQQYEVLPASQHRYRDCTSPAHSQKSTVCSQGKPFLSELLNNKKGQTSEKGRNTMFQIQVIPANSLAIKRSWGRVSSFNDLVWDQSYVGLMINKSGKLKQSNF